MKRTMMAALGLVCLVNLAPAHSLLPRRSIAPYAQSPQVKKAKAPAAPDQWARKDYSDAVGYWPVTGPLARGAKTGYLNVVLYHPVSLKGRPIDDVLSAFVENQEQYYDVQGRDVAVLEGPNLAWDYLRAKQKNGVYRNYSYVAVRTGTDSIRIVREYLTDDDYKDRDGYRPGLKALYRFIDGEVPPDMSSSTSPMALMQRMTKVVQTESRSDRRARQKLAKAAASARRISSVSSAPGKGIPMEAIAGVFMRSGFLKRAYGGKDADYDVFVLLKDGTAYRDPTLPPSDINAEASRRIEPEQWVQWRSVDGGYELRSQADGPWEPVKGKLAKPAPRATMDFTGRHIAAWGDVLMGTAGHRKGSIKLTKDGRYETSSFALAGGSGITGLPSAVVSSSTGKNGRQTTTSSDVAPALINSVKRDPDGTDFTGQYALKGYTAEFLSDSGHLKRTLLLMADDGAVYVGGRYYTVPEKKAPKK